MKTKWTKRLLSGFLSLMMLVCLIPTSAMAEGTGEPITIEYFTKGPNFQNLTNRLFLKNCEVKNDQTSIEPGDMLTINMPSQTTYNEADPAVIDDVLCYGPFLFRYVQICCTQKNGTVDKQYVSFDGTNTVYVPGGAEVTRIPKGSQTYDVSNIPENTTHIDVNYVWGLTQTFSDNEVSNVICEVNRTIEQNSIKKEAVKNEENIDVYNVIGTDKLTLTYNASMNMENLQSNIAGAGSWDVLKNNKEKICDSTVVDLHFKFDKQIDVTKVDLREADLVSDMFTELYNVGSNTEWWDIDTENNELILHCRWDSEKAKADMDGLDPMIYLNNVKIQLPFDWKEKDSIEIHNEGYVDGYVVAKPTTYYFGKINGGKAEDTFILKLQDKISEPGLDKTIVTGYEDDGTPIEVDAYTAAAGENVTFRLNSNIPEEWGEDVIEYSYTEEGTVGHAKENGYTLVFHDVMDSNFTPTGYYFVYLGNSVQPIADKYYIVNSEPGDDCTFEVSVDLAAMYNDGVIKESDFGVTTISVSYNATLNENTVAGDYHNTAHVSYPGGHSEPDDVVVDTYQIEIFKHDQTTHAPLADAEFQLYQKDAEENVIETSKVTLTSGSDGIALTKGLKAGTYYLKETKAPEGYVCSDAEVTIVIPDQIDESTNIAHIEFANSLIPHTGGMGTTLFSIVGGVLIAMAGTVFVISRRKRRA